MRAYQTNLITHAWVKEVQERGAGEIVLNCMNQDGVKKGYDIDQLSRIREICNLPLIASGGAPPDAIKGRLHISLILDN